MNEANQVASKVAVSPGQFVIRFEQPLKELLERWEKLRDKHEERYQETGRRSIAWPRPKPTESKYQYWAKGWSPDPKDAFVFDALGKAIGAAKRHRQRGVRRVEVVEWRSGRPGKVMERIAMVTAADKYDHINFKPPAGASNEAKKAIRWKEQHGDAVKGGTAVGWTRARQLADGGEMSVETVKRMYKFFQRHEKNKAINPKFKDEPWRDNGYVAWLVWGGDAGKRWAEKLWNQMESADEKSKTAKDGLWDNIRQKRERGEEPAKPGDDGYPDEDTWKELTAMSRRGSCERFRSAGIKDVLNKIVRRIRDSELAKSMGKKVMDYYKNKNTRNDLSLQESRMLYAPDNYGETLPLSRKKNLDIGWTDHAEYRSDLRDIDPENTNKLIRDTLKKKLSPQPGKRPNLSPSRPQRIKVPGVGTAVLDYDLKRNPANVDVITVWASDLVRLAQDVLNSPRNDCANCVRKHLGQAAALLQESLQGYPEHKWLAIGHLAEAEAESQNSFPEFALKLRESRKLIESEEGFPDIVSLISEVNGLVDAD